MVEMMVASAVALVVLTMISTCVITLLQTSVGAVQSGSSTGPALLVAQEVQQVLSGASQPGSASDCSGGSSGQPFPAQQGPFVSASGNGIMFCAVLGNSSTEHTYELHFTGSCSSTNTCTLELDQEPSPGCSPCTVREVYSAAGVSDSGTPFTYYYDPGTSWTELSPSPGNLGLIQAVEATLVVQPSGTSASAVHRMILLPHTLQTNGNS